MTGIRSTREQLSLIDDAYSVAGEAVYTSDPDEQLPSLDGYQLPPSFKARKRQSTSITRHYLTSSLWHAFDCTGPFLWPQKLYIWISAHALCEPLTCSCAAALSSFILVLCIALVVSCVRHIQDPDKALMPWRQMCASQPAFLNSAVDHLDPVDFLIGVMSVDHLAERRNVIRNTYVRHTLPLHAQTGRPLSQAQVKFVLGRPRKEYEHAIAMEMEMYNDLIVLDIKESQWSDKTLGFLRWAAENATVPVLVPSSSPSAVHIGHKTYEVRQKFVNYVLKADDDAFIVLEELERRLRAIPRQLSHWGYKIADWFMGGELYALSHDLVQFIAASPEISKWPALKEDEQVPRWLALHPRASDIVWTTEHCWIYDHPRAKTPYAHGFLFPQHVETIRREYAQGLSPDELSRRGGPRKADAYSTTTRWGQAYTPPSPGLTPEESVEALVEGGGRWRDQWHRQAHEPDTPLDVPRRTVWPGNATHDLQPTYEPEAGLAVVEREPSIGAQRHEAGTFPVWGPPLRAYSHQLYNERYVNGTLGGTVAVHFLKQNAWFYETALALIGSQRTWALGGAATEWRMHESPVRIR